MPNSKNPFPMPPYKEGEDFIEHIHRVLAECPELPFKPSWGVLGDLSEENMKRHPFGGSIEVLISNEPYTVEWLNPWVSVFWSHGALHRHVVGIRIDGLGNVEHKEGHPGWTEEEIEAAVAAHKIKYPNWKDTRPPKA